MDRVRGIEYLAVGVVLAVAVAAGPLAGGLVAVEDRGSIDPDELGEGNVTIEDVSLPRSATLEGGQYGSGTYSLEVPEGTAEIGSTTGQPMVIYTLSIPALGGTHKSLYVLSKGRDRLRLTIEDVKYESERIDQDSYEGQLQLDVRTNGTERTVAEATITITVEE